MSLWEWIDSCRTKSEVAEYKYSFRDVKNQKKRKTVPLTLHKDVFQNPIIILFKCWWPHLEQSKSEGKKIISLQPSGECN